MSERNVKTLLKWSMAIVGVLFLAAIIVPSLARRGSNYSGSYEYARQWAT